MEVQNQESMELQPQPQTQESNNFDFFKLAANAQKEIKNNNLKPLANIVAYEFSNRDNNRDENGKIKLGNSFVGVFMGSELIKSQLGDSYYREYQFMAMQKNNELLLVPQKFVVSGVVAEKSFKYLLVGMTARVTIVGVKKGKGEYFTFSVEPMG